MKQMLTFYGFQTRQLKETFIDEKKNIILGSFSYNIQEVGEGFLKINRTPGKQRPKIKQRREEGVL